MKARISVITLAVADLERAVRFYQDGLGFQTQGIVGTEFEHGAVAFFDLEGGLRLALWPKKSLLHDAGLPAAPSSSAAFSIGHNVSSESEVDEVIAEVKQAGGTAVKEPGPTFWGGYAGYFMDLDGHLWEVAFNPAWNPDESL